MLLLLILLVGGCSLQKNTKFSRSYHALTTRFNVYFNAEQSYEEGLKNIWDANKDDYSTVLPLYPISRHSNAAAATANMDRTIEKCRKAIKLHSIKQKPEKDYKKWNSPEYQAFYNQEEFNPLLKEAWLLLGKAEFHKGDFLGSIGTFSYIAHHFAADPDVIIQCQLWMARAYAEMGWLYEAEDVLSKINQDQLKKEHVGLFAAVNADILLKKKEYKEAIPYLQLAIEKESDKKLKQRFTFILGQLYQITGNENAAYQAFTQVLKSNPPFEMDFYARIQRAQLNASNFSLTQKELTKMLKNSKYKDYQDQIYFAMGKNLLMKGDTLKAIENFKSAIDKSTRNGYDKANALITLGDLYYKNKNYKQAYPCYEEASKIITNEHEDYQRVSRLSEILSEWVVQYDIVMLQDSLQRLAALPEHERMETIQKIIAQVKADEEEAIQKSAQEQAVLSNMDVGDQLQPIGGNILTSKEWYFYNPDLKEKGKLEFQKKWGKRKLEDNWRRANKTVQLFAQENGETNIMENLSDTTVSQIITDNKNPAFYLQQIPLTPAQLEKSNQEMATAMFNLGMIYYDKLQDVPMAIQTFEEFVSRFKQHPRLSEAYFQLYLMESKMGNRDKAEQWRTKLITEFPETTFARLLSKPDYPERLKRMYQEQDSIYRLAYQAYTKNDFNTVFQYKEYMEQNYPTSPLMPKFLFLEALSIGKTSPSERFEKELSDLINTYPESDVSSMAKDILALIKQGKQVQTSTTHGSLLAKREEIIKTEKETVVQQQFSPDKKTKHLLLLISDADKRDLNQLMYQLASFNFSRFLIKDFDIGIQPLDSTRNILFVTNFDSYDEVLWYLNTLSSDELLQSFINQLNIKKVIISENNFALLKTTFSLNDYLAFHDKFLAPDNKAIKEITTSFEKKTASTVISSSSVGKPQIGGEIQLRAKTSKQDSILNQSVVPTPQLEKQTEAALSSTTPQIAKEEVTLYKGLFAYKPNEPHFVTIYVVSGNVDDAKVQNAFDKYNQQNYGILNLSTQAEKVGKQQFFIIGPFPDANTAKSYLMRIVKESSLFEGLKGVNYRNLVGTQENLNIMLQQNALNVYFDFMKEYYLK